MIVEENQLRNYIRCPLMDPVPTNRVSPVERTAFQLFQSAQLEAFGGRLLSLKALQLKFDRFWNDWWVRVFNDRPRNGPEYWAGPRAGIRVARRVYQFLNNYEVLRPIQPHDLQLSGQTIRIAAGVVQRRLRRKAVSVQGPMVINLQTTKPSGAKHPHPVALARWAAVMDSGEYMNLGIYHLPLFHGEPWIQTDINEPLARRWLQSIIMMMEPGAYPSPGPHCEQCHSEGCQKVFRG